MTAPPVEMVDGYHGDEPAERPWPPSSDRRRDVDWVPGRDVSHHDGTPDLTEYPWVIIRVGDDGSDLMPSDRKFQRNLEVCLQNRIPFGYYNFTRDNRPAVTQAARLGSFLSTLPRPPLGYWADFESDGGKVPEKPDEFPQWVDDYLAQLDAEVRDTVGVYGGAEFIDDWFHQGVHAHRPLWLARYPKKGDPGLVRDWSSWADWRHGPAIPHTWSSYKIWQFAAPETGAAFDMDLADPTWFALMTEEADMPIVIAAAAANADGRWQHYRLDQKRYILALNGAPLASPTSSLYGVPLIDLDVLVPGHQPITGMAAHPDGDGVIVTANDGGCFHIPAA